MQLQIIKCTCGCTWFYSGTVAQYVDTTTMAGSLPPVASTFRPNCMICAKCGKVKFPSPDAIDMKRPEYAVYIQIINEIET